MLLHPFLRTRHCPLPRNCCGSHQHQDPSPWCLLVLVSLSLSGHPPRTSAITHRGILFPFLLRFFSDPLLPLDPWDPGVTAQDFLFRGGHCYQYQSQIVLDVTEQVMGPWVELFLTACGMPTHTAVPHSLAASCGTMGI